MTLQEINRSIISGNFSDAELTSINDAIRFARSQLIRKNTSVLTLGSAVKFTNSRSGMTVLGTVKKVNRKFIIVAESGKPSTWRVPANMLTAA
jgi:ferredoxin-fold anticodon binding domain-containing protein